MDRSFLSQPEVIEASRKFVCVRLATYEDAEEGELLKSMIRTRSGELENSVFTILTPDAKRQLVRAARSPSQAYDDAKAMAAAMDKIAADYPSSSNAERRVAGLPTVANLRLAVNMAAADDQPLVVVAGGDESRRKVEAALERLVWGERFVGRFLYVAASEDELSQLSGVAGKAGVLVVEPDEYGSKATVLTATGPNPSEADLVRCLAQGAAKYHRQALAYGRHVRDGLQQGLIWETVTPVTDPMEARARERNPGLRKQ
jgi:hypothetical protein